MNKDNAKDYLPLVQALADGKTIQLKKLDGWSDCERTGFSFPPDQYRIKPEPREWTGIISARKFYNNKPGEISFAITMEGTEEDLPKFGETIRVREIID